MPGSPRGKPFPKGHDITRKGVANKATRILKEAMLMAAEQVGDLSGIPREDLSTEHIEKGKDQLVGYLRWAAKCEPRSFLNILGKLLPLQVKVDSFTQTVYHSLEEIQHDISQRGLNMRSFGQLLLEAHKAGEFTADNAAGADAENVEVKSRRD